MARARNIKPAFFMNEGLADCDPLARLLFIGLWMIADREGRLEDRPKRIKSVVLPYDLCEVDALLEQLSSLGFIQRYEVNGQCCIFIPTFVKHQKPHHMEIPSVLPAPTGVANFYHHTKVSDEQRARIFTKCGNRCVHCGSTSSLTIDHKIARSRGGSSEDENLQVLCSKCNSVKHARSDQEFSRERVDHESTTSRPRINGNASRALNPSSLNPSSLNPSNAPLFDEGQNEPAVLVFPVIGKGPTDWPLFQKKVSEYVESFPGVDVLAECKKARQWCIDNSANRKTYGGMPSFLNKWLTRAQNSSRPDNRAPSAKPKLKPFSEISQEDATG